LKFSCHELQVISDKSESFLHTLHIRSCRELAVIILIDAVARRRRTESNTPPKLALRAASIPCAAQLVTGKKETTGPPPRNSATINVASKKETKQISKIISGFRLLRRKSASKVKPISTEMKRRMKMTTTINVKPKPIRYAVPRRSIFVIKKTIAMGLRTSDRTQNRRVMREETGKIVLFSSTGNMSRWYCARSEAP
jgi:hypothetical protein